MHNADAVLPPAAAGSGLLYGGRRRARISAAVIAGGDNFTGALRVINTPDDVCQTPSVISTVCTFHTHPGRTQVAPSPPVAGDSELARQISQRPVDVATHGGCLSPGVISDNVEQVYFHVAHSLTCPGRFNPPPKPPRDDLEESHHNIFYRLQREERFFNRRRND